MKYFEDFVPGEIEIVGDHSLSPGEIVEYGRAWDPQPMHVGPESAAAAELGELVAAGTHLVAITVIKLVTHLPKVAVIAGLGWDEARFHRSFSVTLIPFLLQADSGGRDEQDPL